MEILNFWLEHLMQMMNGIQKTLKVDCLKHLSRDLIQNLKSRLKFKNRHTLLPVRAQGLGHIIWTIDKSK
jgi:hypothetical protein